MAQPTDSWTGCYIGGNAGGVSAWNRQQLTVPGFFTSESSGNATGFIVGGQAGCNWQYSRNWVFGVEGDLSLLDVLRSRTFSSTAGEDVTGTQATRLHWLGTLRGRFGRTWDRYFLYATGGLAMGGVTATVNATVENGSTYAVNASNTLTGWVAGAGFEYAFSRSISARLEYLHFDLGSLNYQVLLTSGGSSLPSQWNGSTRVNGDIVRFGVNFKLNP